MTGDKNLSFPPPEIFDDIIVVNNICGPLGALSCIFGRLSYAHSQGNFIGLLKRLWVVLAALSSLMGSI